MAFKGTENEPSPINTGTQTSKQHTSEDKGIAVMHNPSALGVQVDPENFSGECNEQKKGSGNENKCRVGSSIARKLFMDDTLGEIEGPNNCTNNTDLPQLPACGDDNMSGLSYVDSDEPGELSQDNALDFVDRFLKFNVMDFDQEGDTGRSTGGKSKPISSTKGTQSVAKRKCFMSTAGERGTFDWDDSHEDEGGGVFFTKNKESFFDSRGGRRKRSSTKRQKLTKGCGAVDETRYNWVMLQNSKRDDKKINILKTKSKWNVNTELDEQLKIAAPDGIEATGTDEDMPEMLNVGFDNQMAAEAMEVLCFGLDVTYCDNKDTSDGTENGNEGSSKGEKGNRVWSKTYVRRKRSSSIKKCHLQGQAGTLTPIACRTMQRSVTNPPRAGLDVTSCDNKDTSDGTKHVNEGSSRGEKGNRAWSKTYVRRKRSSSVTKCHLQGQAGTFTPIACRTRQRNVTNPLRAGIGLYDSGKASTLNSKQSGELEKLTDQEQSYQKLSDTIAAITTGELRRTCTKVSGQLNGSSDLHGSVNQDVWQETTGQSPGKSNRSETNALKRKKRASIYDGSVLSAVDKGVSGFDAFKCSSIDGNVTPKDMVGALASNLSDKQSDADTISAGGNAKLEVLPVDKCKPSGSVSATPIRCTTPVSAASPICLGDEYLKHSCRKNLSRSFLMREISSLISGSREATFTTINSRRRRREMANVRVLFSHHLNGDIIKQQKKILARLGASVAPSISEATHFVTDKFVRTGNMLEAIAFGKPVVTHVWLENSGQAGCFIDERSYILRDAKKEKEFGFSLPVSLARACQHPLLQGQKVLITRNTKPGKELLTSLVNAVHGQAVERIGRLVFKDGKIPGDLLVLSCEEDYAISAPFLEKGAAVYSSELLLNGIVTQRLEYERHRLFAEQMKKTRSTIWLNQNSDESLPITKRK